MPETQVVVRALLEADPRFVRTHENSWTVVGAPPLRRALDEWFDRHDVTPMVVAEFDDSALMKAFGEAASGIFPAPDAIASEVEQMYDARQIGTVDGVSESFYAISPERKLKHPAVLRITESARQRFLV